jgi:tRNA A37 threonylcarbamoyltransferase TsaD
MLWQIKIHTQYGGVVPELASRAHQQNIVPVIDAALHKANIDKEQLSAIAFTQGPVNGVTSGGKFFCKIDGLIHTSCISKPYASPYFSSFHR